ncbi:S-adenosyl-L-methionine-dependent methyltransferase, partial [uncultured Caudovirales phage]
GFETVAFCEIEPFPRKVLAKHWPEVPIYDDVRTLTAERLAADGIAVDVICGGFPCQDISTAGKGAGLAGERSGLWSEIARLAGELQPQFIIVENVAALLGRGLGDVLGDLASLGYDAEWHCIPAAYVGAPHRRDRIWIVAYPCGELVQQYRAFGQLAGETRTGQGGEEERQRVWDATGSGSEALADAASCGRVQGDQNTSRQHCECREAVAGFADRGEVVANPISFGQSRQGQPLVAGSQAPLIDRQAVDAFAGGLGDIWRTEPDVGRVANGVPDRAHRLKGLGNAVVPQIPELIGHAILAAIQSRSVLSAAGSGASSFSPVNLPAVAADQGGGRLCVPFHATEIAGE